MKTPRTDAAKADYDSAMALFNEIGATEAVRRGVKATPDDGWKLAARLEEELIVANSVIERAVPLDSEAYKEVRNSIFPVRVRLIEISNTVAATFRSVVQAAKAGNFDAAIVAAHGAIAALRAAKWYSDHGYQKTLTRRMTSKLPGAEFLKRSPLFGRARGSYKK
jgi:hypothetical protein